MNATMSNAGTTVAEPHERKFDDTHHKDPEPLTEKFTGQNQAEDQEEKKTIDNNTNEEKNDSEVKIINKDVDSHKEKDQGLSASKVQNRHSLVGDTTNTVAQHDDSQLGKKEDVASSKTTTTIAAATATNSNSSSNSNTIVASATEKPITALVGENKSAVTNNVIDTKMDVDIEATEASVPSLTSD